MSENKTRVLLSNSEKRVHKTSKGSPIKKKLKFSDLNKTKNKGKLIKVKIKQLKIKQNIGIAKNSKTWAHKVKLWSTVWRKNRVTFQGNTTTKRFEKRWLLLLSGEPLLKQEKLRETLAH